MSHAPHAVRQVQATLGELRAADFTPDLVCEQHRIGTDGTLDDASAAGRLRADPDPRQRVAVTGDGDGDGDGDQILHVPPPAHELPVRLARLCAFANETSDATWMQPVLRSLAIHFMVGYDHYFEGGNGRTARALFYWSMLKRGYWLTEFLTISRILNKAPAQYARSYLYTEQDAGDLTYFFLYHPTRCKPWAAGGVAAGVEPGGRPAAVATRPPRRPSDRFPDSTRCKP